MYLLEFQFLAIYIEPNGFQSHFSVQAIKILGSFVLRIFGNICCNGIRYKYLKCVLFFSIHGHTLPLS